LSAAQEAADLYRELTRDRPDAFAPDLAMSLNNLANRLSDLGQREAALSAAQEAVTLRRELARDRPDAFTPDLAMSLHTLANRLSALGQREAALRAAQEAADLRRALARERPDAFTPDLASSLNNLAVDLSDLGQREAALSAAQEAADLYRELTRDRPDAFAPDLAMSLGVLGQILRADEPAKARDCFAEGIEILTPVFLRYPAGLASLMDWLKHAYLASVEQLDEAPDEALLAPVVEVFAQLQKPDEEGGVDDGGDR
ncbi:MAG: tetratricopeptide repeat protein, partial [Thiotrichales bacterium]